MGSKEKETKLIQLKLQQSEERYHKMIEEVSDYAIIMLSPEGIIENWNKGAEKIKGYSAHEIIGKTFKVFYSEEDQKNNLPDRLLEEARRTGRVAHEGWRMQKGGTRFWGSVVITALHDDANNVIGFTKVTRDLTERKHAEDRLREYTERLEKANYELDALNEELAASEEQLAQANAELKRNAENLEKANHELAALNEELTASEEQLMEANAELKRNAETLETANHELAALNEELTASEEQLMEANAELKRNAETLQKKNFALEEFNEELTASEEQLMQANARLKRSEERYNKMVTEVSDYAILLLSPEGIIENWNKGAEKIKGYSASEIIGKNFNIFYTTDDQNKGLPGKLLDQARQTDRASYEGWRVRKDGSKFWGHVVITSLHDDRNKVIGFTKVTRDLTERKLAEDKLKKNAKQLEQQNKELTRMNQELASFAYVSSHDLQEPLRKIQVFITRLTEVETNLSETGKNFFLRIQNAANRMQRLIEDLLSYARTDTDQRKIETTDLNVILNQVKADLREKIEETHAEIKSAKLPTIDAVAFQFNQLLANLIGNSLKFSKQDIPPKIEITAEVIDGNKIPDHRQSADKRFHHIIVTDNGIGFDSRYNEKIFEVFQRLHGRSEYSGTGIGLAICKRIIENHGGFIRAEGKPGVGAVFHIYLPDNSQ